MARKQINVGSSNFKNIILNNSYYIDKTLLIEELLNKKSKVLLITRPRRFGKTMNMTMLKYFFDIENRKNNRALFRGLNIEKTKYISEQGKYPVIFFTMEDISGLTYEEFRQTFNSEIKIYSSRENSTVI